MPAIHVHLLPQQTTPQAMAGSTVVIIDVLRATTTIVHALAAGAKAVHPCLEVQEARERHRAFPAGSAVLGGERSGKRIVGFDLGNSPLEFNSRSVAGKQVVLTTTNGTRAISYATGAAEILFASFNNLTAIVQHLRAVDQDVHLVCAGTDGLIAGEDTLLAGALTASISVDGGHELGNDPAQIAAKAWEATGVGGSGQISVALESAFRQFQGGRNLIEIGQATDLATAAQIDLFSIVPTLDRTTWQIR